MSFKIDEIPLIVVVGETASGKSSLAMKLAAQFNGALICADSRTIYRGMDIGTAKPSLIDRQDIQHYCLDIVNPDEHFTVADFKAKALEAITDIYAKGELPILVGGTGLYINSVIFDYQFMPSSDVNEREVLTRLSVDELQNMLLEKDIDLPTNSRNPRHLVRAIETGGKLSKSHELQSSTLMLGLEVDATERTSRIGQRLDTMCQMGLEQEALELSRTYGWGLPSMQTIGYQEWESYFKGTQSLEDTKQLIIRHTIQYSKRQRTWFNRNKSIHRLLTEDTYAESVALVTTHLNK